MTATTTIIYAWALRPADTVNGRTVKSVTSRDTTWVTWADDRATTFVSQHGVVVGADTDPDAGGVWVPEPGFWPSGCRCPLRRHPDLAGNWERVPTPAPCDACDPHDEDD